MSKNYDFYDLEKVEELAGRPETVEIDGYYWDTSDLPPKEYLDEQVPLPFRNLSRWMRSKMNGLQTRETMGRLIEMVGINTTKAVNVAERTQYRQDAVEDFNTQVIQEMTDKDVISAPEIIQARGGKPTLAARLDVADAMITDIDLALSQMHINVKSLGAKGDGVTDDTAILNYAMQNYTNVWIPDGEYMVDAVASLRPTDNTTIRLSKGAVIRALPTSEEYYEIFELAGRKGITISGGKIYGERDEHIGTTGEWGHGINMRGSQDITLEDLEIHDCWGDGIYVGILSAGQVVPKNIRLKNVISNNNRRQGMSVITVDGLYGENVTLSNTNGTLPQAGIDFEPNQSTEILDNIHFVNLRCINNAGDGLISHLSKFTGDNYQMNWVFDNYYSEGNRTGINFDKFNGEATGNIVFNNPVVKDSNLRNYGLRAMSKKFAKVIFNNPVSIDTNRSGTVSTSETADFCMLRTANDYPEDMSFIMGNVEINHPKIVWTDDTPRNPASTMSFSDPVSNRMEEVDIIGADQTYVTGMHLLDNSTYDVGRKEIIYDYWLGSTPFVRAVPHNTNIYTTYELGTDRSCVVNLTKTLNPSYPYDIKVKHMGVDYGSPSMYIRPPADESLYPLSYAKGLMMKPDVGGEGSYVTLRREDNKWKIVEMVGPWEVEP